MNIGTSPVNLRVAIKSLNSLPALPLIAQKLLILNQAAEQADQATSFVANLG